MTDENLPARLTRLRQQAGLSKYALAKKIGTSDVSVGYWERGIVKTINSDLLMRLAEALNVTVSELVGDPLLNAHDAKLLTRHSEVIQKMADDVPYGMDAGEESAALERAAEYLYDEARRLRTPHPETSIN